MNIGTTHKDSQTIPRKHQAKKLLKIKERAAKPKRRAVSITPTEASFWQHLTVEELAARQRVNPVTDLSLLQGTWPGKDENAF